MLDEIGKPLDAVILLEVSDEVATALLERARRRGPCRRLARRRSATGSASTTSSPSPVVERYQLEGIVVHRRRRAGRWTRCSRRSRTRWRRSAASS